MVKVITVSTGLWRVFFDPRPACFKYPFLRKISLCQIRNVFIEVRILLYGSWILEKSCTVLEKNYDTRYPNNTFHLRKFKLIMEGDVAVPMHCILKFCWTWYDFHFFGQTVDDSVVYFNRVDFFPMGVKEKH